MCILKFNRDYKTDICARLNFLIYLLLSLTHVIVEKVLFSGKIFEIEILMDLHVLRPPKSEKHIFSFWSIARNI